jgi:hypothetical protein
MKIDLKERNKAQGRITTKIFHLLT